MEGPKGRGWPPATTRLDWRTALVLLTLLIRLYTLLGHYVEATCNNDPATFNTSGFTAVVKTRTAPQPLAPVKFSSIDRGPNSGQTVVNVENQNGVLAFDVQYAQEGTGGVPGPWTFDDVDQLQKGDYQWPHAGRNLPVPGPRAG